jgi:predicted class III extradiol MEMO1 family dioxygenase
MPCNVINVASVIITFERDRAVKSKKCSVENALWYNNYTVSGATICAKYMEAKENAVWQVVCFMGVEHICHTGKVLTVAGVRSLTPGP